jgi:hypothetical protein
MEIIVGTNAPVKQRVFWKGQIAESDFLPTVKFYDVTEDPSIDPPINPNTAISTQTSEASETDIGVYLVYPPLSITNRPRLLKLVWEYEVGGEEVVKEHKVSVVKPYADLTEAAELLGFGFDQSDPNYKTFADLAAAERYARKLIENYTSQKFYLYDDTNTVYATGSDVLPLPQKINTLHNVYLNDILLLDNINEINNWNLNVEISDSGFGLRIDRLGTLDNTVYVANGMIPPSINDTYGGAFVNGGSYRVSGKYGWSEVPSEVSLACIELMKDFFSKDKTWRNKYIKSIQTFDWQFQYDTSSFSGTGNNYADQLLSGYVMNQMVVI